jgi:dolichyl-phosphate beta-glucosyltransferase
MPFLSIIVPAYNEVHRIAGTLDSMRAFLNAQPYDWEIIVSADGTDGIELATGEIIGFIDADYKTPIEEVDKLLPVLKDCCDLAIGSRKVGEARIEVAQPLFRRAGSAAFHMVMGTMLGLADIRDTQCGFKFARHDVAKRLFKHQRIDGYMFDVEILRLARLMKLRIREIGVRWRDDGDSRYAPISGTIKNARELMRIRMMRYGDLS